MCCLCSLARSHSHRAVFSYWAYQCAGGGGGGVLFDGSGPNGTDGAMSPNEGHGGIGYGAGGGGGGAELISYIAAGGNGASGFVYLEWG